MKRLAAIAVLAAACSGSSTPPPPAPELARPAPAPPEPAAPEPAPPEPAAPEPAPTKPVPASAPAASLDVAKLGSPCDPDGGCAAGMTCLRYYGFAGTRGPEFSSCELACARGATCPAGTRCVTIADGPGAVCRAP